MHCTGNYMLVVLIHSGHEKKKKKESQKERSPPTKSLEVGGLREDGFSDGTLPLTRCFFLCKINIIWPGGGNPLLPQFWEWTASVSQGVFVVQALLQAFAIARFFFQLWCVGEGKSV